MKFLIAGFGSIGRRHYRNLLALGEHDFVFLRSNLGTLPDDEISGYPCENDMDSALAHYPDVVVISNPTSLHLDVAIPAALAGCHLFIEKPLSHSMDRIDQLVAAVRSGGGKVLIGFQFRYHPQLFQISNLLADEVIGKPLSVRVQWGEYLPDWHPWEDYRKGYSAQKDLGGGVVLTLSHPLDYLRWLLGELSDLWAFTSQADELSINVESVSEIGLRFKNGVIGSVHLDYVQRPPTHTLEIIGSNGKVTWDYHKGETHVYRNSGEDQDIFRLPTGFQRNQLFQDQMKHLISVVQGKELPRCSLSDGVMTQKIVMAVYRSVRESIIVSW